MLRITVATGTYGGMVALEGRLAGPWVDELRACWRGLAAARDPRSIRVDLDGATFIDAGGKALLWAMHEQGAALRATGCMTRATVEEIQKDSHLRGTPTVHQRGDE
jgi:hypothetical protein